MERLQALEIWTLEAATAGTNGHLHTLMLVRVLLANEREEEDDTLAFENLIQPWLKMKEGSKGNIRKEAPTSWWNHSRPLIHMLCSMTTV